MSFSIEKGLSKKQYQQNVVEYGLNKLPEIKPPTKLEIFLRQLRSPLIYILIIAATLTFVLGDILESVGIGLVVAINSVLGFIQENRAEATLASLRAEIKPTSTVLRDGKEKKVSSNDITVGDIVILKLGDKVPADGVILSGENITTNESVLTGESRAEKKQPASSSFSQSISKQGIMKHAEDLDEQYQLFMGTAVLSGIATMLVTKIGTEAKFGQIAGSLAEQEEGLTPLQQQIENFSKLITYIIAGVSIFIFLYGLLLGKELVEIIELAISVAVSAVPEGLVIALTIILTLGMSRILKRKALVRKLIAAETLGSVDTICVDKTGTLTEGKMQVTEVRFNDLELGKRALVATNNRVNSVETSLADWVDNRVSARELASFRKEKYVHQKIFDSDTKFSATLGTENLYVVGAPEIVLEHCEMTEKRRKDWEKEIRNVAKQGSRLVAVATKSAKNIDAKSLNKKLPSQLEWLGLVLIDDPVRPDLSRTFQLTDMAGISIKVITGDIADTALAVLRKVGLDVDPGEEIISGKELRELSDKELSKRVEKLRLFYRTTPDQKLRIVTALQENGHSVAMMGDGINDTPALKRAEIGIVVENATSFSKEIADMVLLDSNFKTIVAAVKEGRTIFDNMRKVLAYLLSDAFEVLTLVLLSFILHLPVPLLPLQILYINFVTDSMLDLALAFESSEKRIMSLPPRDKNKPLLDRDMAKVIGIIIAVVTLTTFSFFYFLIHQGWGSDYVRTFIFLLLSLNSLIYIFSIRSFRKAIWEYNPFENNILNITVLIAAIWLFIGIYVPPFSTILQTVPLGVGEWVVAAIISFVDLAAIEVVKKLVFREDSSR